MKNFKKSNWLFAGLVLLAAAVRLVAIQDRSIQYDDAFSIILSSQSFSEIIAGTAADTMPPLYYFLLHLWMGLGASIWFYRLLSLFFSLGTLVFIYLIASRISNKNAANWACLLFAISPIHYYHSQDLRMYAMLTFFVAAYNYFCIIIFENNVSKRRQIFRYFFLTIFGAFAFYSHNLAGFLLLIPDAYLILRKKFKSLVGLAVSQFISFLLFLPWLAFVPGQISKIQTAFWTPKPGLAEILQVLIMFTANLPLPGVLLPVGMILAALIFASITLWVIKTRKNNSECLYPLVMFLFPPAILFFVSYVMRPVFVPRGFLISSVGFYLLAGIFLANIFTKKITSDQVLPVPKISGLVVLIGFIFSSVIGLYSQFTYMGFPRSPFKSAMMVIANSAQPGDCVIHDNKLSYFPSVIYQQDLPQKFLPDDPGGSNDTFAYNSQVAMKTFPEQNIESALVGCDKLYFVVFNLAIEEYGLSGSNEHPIIQWLDSNRNFDKKTLVNDLWVYEYH